MDSLKEDRESQFQEEEDQNGGTQYNFVSRKEIDWEKDRFHFK